MKKPKNTSYLMKNIFLVLLGNIIYATTVKLFLLPANLMSSGTTGIALVINHLTDFSIPLFIALFNIAALVVGLIFLGKKFFMTTILSSLLYPAFLEVLNKILPEDIFITDKTILNVLFSGIGLGLALGLVIRSGASTGGMDIPVLILNKYFKLPISIVLYVFDFCIILCQIFYHTAEDLLYGVLLLLLTSIVLDKTLLWGDTKTEVKIISNKSEEIKGEILSEVDRGVTLLYGEGGYSGKESQIVLTVVSNRELVKIEKLVRNIDPDCFMIVSSVREVWGKGFSIEKTYK
ncbi:MAG: YitT family protein [Ruminococcaceae bacterium]|nr:YitT family protein [Oscillospiraceae bacterium]